MYKTLSGISLERAHMDKLFSYIGRLLTLGSLGYLGIKLKSSLGEVSGFNWTTGSISVLLMAVVVSAIMVIVGAVIWAILLGGGGINISFKNSCIIVGKSQINKYLPGNIFQYVGRISAGQRFGIPLEAALLSIGAEALLGSGSAAAIAVFGVTADPHLRYYLPVINLWHFRYSWWGALLLGLPLLLLIMKPSFRAWVVKRLGFLHPPRILICILLYIFAFAANGVVIDLLLRNVWQVVSPLHWYHYTWGFASAWVLGYIVPGAPGGIGIREAVLVSLFGTALGDGIAVSLALMLRIITILGDILAFALGWWLENRLPLQAK